MLIYNILLMYEEIIVTFKKFDLLKLSKFVLLATNSYYKYELINYYNKL